MIRLKARILIATFPILPIVPAFASASECQGSVPNFVSPVFQSESDSYGWYGSENLAALIRKDGHWNGMGKEHNFRDKFWWSADGYDAHTDSNPNLVVFAENQDSPGSIASASQATNAFGDNWDAMLVMLEFPNAGCWQITGTYGDQAVQLVLSVGSE